MQPAYYDDGERSDEDGEREGGADAAGDGDAALRVDDVELQEGDHGAEEPHVDGAQQLERERLRGPGRVGEVDGEVDGLGDAGDGVDGEVAFDIEGDHRVLRARSFDDGALAAGTEVVIERIENDVAYVEAWMEVEKRL